MITIESLIEKKLINKWNSEDKSVFRFYVNKVELAKIAKELKADLANKGKIPFLSNDAFSLLVEKTTRFYFLENETELKTSLAPEQKFKKEILAYVKAVLELIKE